MTLSEAKREFEIRVCYWLHAELKTEISNLFPNLRLFRSGYGWQLHHFMQKLEPSDRFTLANAMVKRDPTYLEASGETMTEEEKALWDSFRQFFNEPSGLEVEIQLRKQAGEKIKLPSKRKLRKAAVSKFVEAFGSQCFDMNLGEEWDPLFHMKCCGWVISTQLYFGRSQPLIDCRHMVVSETRIAHPQDPEITGPAMTLSLGVGWLANQWEHIVEDDMEPACNALVRHAGFFF